MKRSLFLIPIFSLLLLGAGSAPRIDQIEVQNLPNNLINGNFDLWQRGTSQTQATVTLAGTGYGVGAADRWYVNWGTIPTAYTFSRQAATPGELSGEPTYYARMAITTIGSGAAVRIEQHIESARSFAGKSITLSFWGKNTVAVQPIIDAQQVFGTGGSPSSATTITCATLPAMTTSWAKYTATCAIPSISGKTFGTTSGSDYLNIRIRMTDVNQQFDIAQVMLNEGTKAAPFKLAGWDTQGELAKAQRYYEKSYNLDVTPGTAQSQGSGEVACSMLSVGSNYSPVCSVQFKVQKRAACSAIRIYNLAGSICNVSGCASYYGIYNVPSHIIAGYGSTSAIRFTGTNYPGQTDYYVLHWYCDSEL